MIFLSYASEDRSRAVEIFERLSADGFDVWMDVKKILPGQEWEAQIWRAAAKADLFCILLSSRSVDKRGFIRREIRFALEKWKEMLPEDIYLVPCRIEPIDPPIELRHLQYVDVIDDNGITELERALRHSASERGTENDRDVADPSNAYNTEKLKPIFSNVDFEIQYPFFRSADLVNLNAAVGQYTSEILSRWNADAPPPPSVSSKSFVDGGFSVQFPTPRIVSLQFSVFWYGAGAAHPNQSFKTFCFDRIAGENIGLKALFANPESALMVISNVCRLELRKQKILEGFNLGPFPGEDDWIDEGAEAHWDRFANFVIKDQSLELLFAPYTVGSYAEGPRFVEIEISGLQQILSDRIVDLVSRLDGS